MRSPSASAAGGSPFCEHACLPLTPALMANGHTPLPTIKREQMFSRVPLFSRLEGALPARLRSKASTEAAASLGAARAAPDRVHEVRREDMTSGTTNQTAPAVQVLPPISLFGGGWLGCCVGGLRWTGAEG